MNSLIVRLIVSFFVLLFVIAPPVTAGTLKMVRIPNVAFAAHPITVDGKLDDWAGVEGISFQPFDVGFVADSTPLVKQLQAKPSSAKVSFCYDMEALYCAIDWTGSHVPLNTAGDGAAWWKNGDGIELHVLTDQAVHVASWPLAEGKVATAERLNEQTVWSPADRSAITSALVLKPDKTGYTEELRLPWAALTKTKKIPADGKIEIACDLVWKDLGPDFVRQLPEDARVANNFSFGFLTTPGHYASQEQIGAVNWGSLNFGTTAAPVVVQLPLGSGLSALAVPQAQGPVTVDAGLRNWSVPFAGFEVLPALLGSRYGGKISAQYDANNLYFGAHFQTSGPLQNLMPESTQQGFRGGDSLQIRLQGNGKTINLCGWFDSTDNKPALTADGADLAQPFLLKAGAQEAFVPDADGMGYSQTMAIPWQALGLSQGPPRAGEQWKGTFQTWWSGLDPRFTLYGGASLTKQGVLQAGYQLPADGEVTLGLYDGTKLLRAITKDEFRTKGSTTDSWDGLDQWGKPVPAGSYTLKGIYHPHLSLGYIMSFFNPGNPPWPTPDGKGDWLSDEEAPQGAATDGKWVFLAAPGNELGYTVIGVDEIGQRQWGVQLPYNPHTVSLAVAGDYLYVLYAGPRLTDNHMPFKTGDTNAIERDIVMCLDKKTGRAAQFTHKTPQLVVHTAPFGGTTCDLWDLRKNRTFSPDIYTGQPRYYTYNIGSKVSAIGLAAANDRLYVALHDEGEILVLDAATGTKVDEILVPKPAGLYARDEHTLLAVSDRQVVQIDTRTKQVNTVIANGLLAPRCVTAGKDGHFYVSDWGASFQVKIFSPNGSLLGSVGKAGGRPWVGKWDPSGMLVPTGIAVTDAGRLWVAEDDEMPNRVSVWDTRTGALLKEYLGPATYTGAQTIIDPRDKTVAYSGGLQYRLDYDTKTCTPVATVNRRMDRNQPFTGHERDCVDFKRAYYHDGHEYHVLYDSMMTTILMRKGDVLVPVAAVGCLANRRTIDGTQRTIRDDFGYRVLNHYFPEFFAGHAGDNYSWVDANNDGLVQPEEIHWVKTSKDGHRTVPGEQPELRGALGGGVGIDPDWNLFWSGTDRDGSNIYRLDLKGWTAFGAPIYHIEDSRPIITQEVADVESGPTNLYATSEGNVIANYNYEYGKSPNILEAYSRDGKPLWAIKKTKQGEQGDKDVLTDAILGEYHVPGLGNVLYGWLWHANYYPYLITTDGLMVSTLLERTRSGPAAIWGESWNFPYQDAKGQCYVVNGTSDTDHILKLNGLDQGGRFEAPLQLTQADVDRAAAVRAIPDQPVAPKPVLNVAWNEKPPVVDGNLADWNLRTGVALQGEKGCTAQVALARDATNLYLAYQVQKDVPFANKGGDWQSLFVTGDCVDLMLGTDPKAPLHHQEALPGDERVLMSVYQGKPIAVLYRPSVPGSKVPVTLSRAQFDEIKRLDSARVMIQTKGNSYTVEASIPLADLGINLRTTDTLKGDVGVIFSDETGTNRSQRLYFFNKKTSMISDLSTEATLQPGEWGTIQFPLGMNLVKNDGFEGELATDPTQGWSSESEKNGAQAKVGDESPRSGRQSLILEQTTPVLYAASLFQTPQFADFRKGANNGLGEGEAKVRQIVPVQAGHAYAFRYNYRAMGLHIEKQQPGPDRGFVRFAVDVTWLGANGKPLGEPGFQDTRTDSPDWQQMINPAREWSIPKPYLAPAGAVSAMIGMQLNVAAPNDLPKVYVDDVEFVDASAPTNGAKLP